MRLLFFLLFCSAQLFAGPNDIRFLLDNIAAKESRMADFVETRSAFFLSEPTISKGMLEFKKPTTLIKTIHSPEASLILIKNNVLSINGKHGINLDEEPILAVPIKTILWILNGDLPRLTETFSIRYENNNQAWVLDLVPKSSNVLEEIKKIVVIGNREIINRIKITKANGDTIDTELYEK